MRFNVTVLLAVLCLLGIGVILSISGCVSQEKITQANVSAEQISATISTPMPMPEKVCYETDLIEDCPYHAPFCHPFLMYQPSDYFVHIDPIADHKEGDVFQINGCTNAPTGVTFWGGITQSEYFTPAGEDFIPPTVKNISLMPGCNDTIQYFSYEVNSTNFEYSMYTVYILPTDPYDKNTSVFDARFFNITHPYKITCPVELPPPVNLKKLVRVTTHRSEGMGDELQPNYFTYNESGCTTFLPQCSWFYVLLPENPTTGYQWDLNITDGLEIVNSDYVPDDNPLGLEGVGGTHVWAIRAAEREYMTVTGVYKQPWMDATGDDLVYSLIVHVLPKDMED